MRGGQREGAGRPKGTIKDPTVAYHRRVKPQWVEKLDAELNKLKGIEKMKNLTKSEILDMMIDYVSGTSVDFQMFGEKENAVRNWFGCYIRDWEALPCSPEGSTKEQQKAADELDKYYSELIFKEIQL